MLYQLSYTPSADGEVASGGNARKGLPPLPNPSPARGEELI
jgi:hypothetical protein